MDSLVCDKKRETEKVVPVKGTIGILCIVVFTILVVQRGWMCDDIYITMRTVRNFVSGNGLVWNIGERVQVYTHPLWMFVLSLGYAISHETFLTTILISVLFSVLTLILIIWKVSVRPIVGCAGVLLLGLSSSFLDHSTGGLENPLSHFLLALFAWVYFNGSDQNNKKLFLLCFVSSLAAVNRLDNFIVYLPALFYAWKASRPGNRRYAILSGFSPLIAWEIFSLIYYGFLLPNTAYAKMNTTLSPMEFWRQGLFYYGFTLKTEAYLFVILAFGFFSVFVPGGENKAKFLASGMILYLLYVVNIGGDFMGGRYFTLPLLCSVILLTRRDMTQIPIQFVALAMAAFLILAAVESAPPWTTNVFRSPSGYHDMEIERQYYFPGNQLFTGYNYLQQPVNALRTEGEKLAGGPYEVIRIKVSGMVTFFTDPNFVFLDSFGLTDPFLARIPYSTSSNWRVGHLDREIPDYYFYYRAGVYQPNDDIEMIRKISNLDIITRGPIWSLDRWIAIVEENFSFAKK